MSVNESAYINHNLAARLYENIKGFWKDGTLCDVQIDVCGKIFHAHKIVLAACSDYFKVIFTHETLGIKQNVVILQDITEVAMQDVLNFCYTSNVTLDAETIQEVLAAASILQIHELVEICERYIQDNIDIDNCIGVLSVADRYNLRTCRQTAFDFCLDNFYKIKPNQFHDLDETLLTSILEHDQLNVIHEEDVFRCIEEWVNADRDARLPKMANLMRRVRFLMMSPLTLVELSKNDLILDSPNCHDFIISAKDHYLLLGADPEERERLLGPMRFQPRKPRNQRIYAIGGWTNEYRSISSVERYDPYSDTWTEVKPMIKPRCGVGVTILGNSLYVVGGHDGQNHLKCTERYDILTDTWHEDLPAMNSVRTSVGVVTLNGQIYAIGGQIGSSSSDQVERYEPKSNRWIKCRPLSRERLGAGVTVVNGYIYVVGGSDQREVFSSMERYDPFADEWEQMAPMGTPRKHLGCTSYDGDIYVVGGKGENGELCTVERYDPGTNSWEFLPDMSEKRSGIGLIELDGLLYAAGGWNGDIKLKLVEVYDPITMTWSERNPMIYERLGGGYAVHPHRIG